MAAKAIQSMHIAMLSIHSSPMGPLGTQNTGGMSVYVRELARWLGHQGHTVDIFTYVDATEDRTDLFPNVRLIHLNQKGLGQVEKADLPAKIESIWEALEKYCRKNNQTYDLIHSHYWISAVVGAIAQAKWHCPHMVTFHTLGAAKNLLSAGENEPIRRIAHERWLAKVADGIVVPSEQERINLLCHYHPHPGKIHTLPCGVNLERFRPLDRDAARQSIGMPKDIQMALYVGRIAPVKGMDILIGAMAHLKEQMPHLRLVVAGGDGPDAKSTQQLKQKVDQHQLASRVTFVGRVDQKDLPLYYSAADFLVLPSHYESFALVVLEALACGTPVVATPVGVVQTIIEEGINGVIAANSEVKPMAEAITRMLAVPKGAQVKIRTTVKGLHWNSIAVAMAEIYRELLDGGKTIGNFVPKAYRHTRPNLK